MADNKNQICFMCGRTKSQVKTLLKGKYGCICDECINGANDTLIQMEAEQQKQEFQLMKPSQMKAHLDDYVIGQDDAKRVLSRLMLMDSRFCRIFPNLSDKVLAVSPTT